MCKTAISGKFSQRTNYRPRRRRGCHGVCRNSILGTGCRERARRRLESELDPFSQVPQALLPSPVRNSQPTHLLLVLAAHAQQLVLMLRPQACALGLELLLKPLPKLLHLGLLLPAQPPQLLLEPPLQRLLLLLQLLTLGGVEGCREQGAL